MPCVIIILKNVALRRACWVAMLIASFQISLA
eukprot:SAG25_NODE_2811_length_1374_cov_3.356078_3_plen_31_part_01